MCLYGWVCTLPPPYTYADCRQAARSNVSDCEAMFEEAVASVEMRGTKMKQGTPEGKKLMTLDAV